MNSIQQSIYKVVEQVSANKGIDIELECCGSNIRLSGVVEAWIRITDYSVCGLGICVDINSIAIASQYQRRGVFTKLMSLLRLQENIDTIIISSICTTPMLSWCNKNGCTLCGDYTFRYK